MMNEVWKKFRLKDLSSVITKGTTPSTYGYKFQESGINYIRAQSLSYDGNIDEGSFSFISSEAHEKLKRSKLVPNDILFSMAGAYLGMVGIVNKSHCPANTNQAVGIIRINHPETFPKYVQYVLRNPKTTAFVNAQSGQSAQPNINLREIGDLTFLIPPLKEQKAIASILSALDDKIELNLQMNKTLEAMAMALYKHWFVDFGPFQDGEFLDSELGKIPKGWEVKVLEDFIELNPKLKIQKGHKASFVEMKALPTDAMSVSRRDKKEFKGGSKFQNGDTLFARITPCLENGKTAFVDFLEKDEIAFGSTEFLIMRAKRDISKSWTYCLARDPNFRNFASSTMVGTSGRQRVQNQPLLSYEIVKPPSSIFALFHDQVENWFLKVRLNTIENQTLTKLRDTLLPKLISGEVRVKDIEKTIAAAL